MSADQPAPSAAGPGRFAATVTQEMAKAGSDPIRRDACRPGQPAGKPAGLGAGPMVLATVLHLSAAALMVLWPAADPLPEPPVLVVDLAMLAPATPAALPVAAAGPTPPSADTEVIAPEPPPAAEPAPVSVPDPPPPPEPAPEPPPPPEPEPEPPPPPEPTPAAVPPVRTERAKPPPKPRPKPEVRPAAVAQPRPPAAEPVPAAGEPASPQPSPLSPATAPASVAAPAPLPSPAVPPADESPRPDPAYATALLRWLERHREYPREARLQRIEGRVVLRLRVARDGRILSASIEAGSGHPILDEAVLDMARRASPVPAFPDRMAGAIVELLVPVTFEMRR